MARTWKAGVIGLGSIAQALHIPGYLKTRGVDFVAGADPKRKQRQEVAALAPGAKLYTDHRKMLTERELDVVSICTPNYLHAQHSIDALAHGAHVLLEKPAALSLAEIEHIRKAQAKADRLVVVGFSHRFMNGPRKAKQLIEDGAIGRPYMIRVRFAHTGPFPGWAHGDWFYDPAQAGGGAMLDMGIHAIDLCQWLIGPIGSVAAQVAALRKQIAVDDNAVLALAFADGGAMGYIDVGWTSPAGFTGLEIMGDAGAIRIDYGGAMSVTSCRASADLGAGDALTTRIVARKPTAGGWAIEIREIIKAVKRGDDLGLGLDAGGSALAVALAAAKSAKTGRRVEL